MLISIYEPISPVLPLKPAERVAYSRSASDGNRCRLHRLPTWNLLLAHHRLRVTKSSRITFVTFPSNVMVSLFSRMLSTLPSPNIG